MRAMASSKTGITGIIDQLEQIDTWIAAAIVAAGLDFGKFLVRRTWKRMTPGQQYLSTILPLNVATILPLVVAGWLLTPWLDIYGFVFIPAMGYFWLWGFSGISKAPLKRFDNNYLQPRTLYKNQRTRTCKRCGHFDATTRELVFPNRWNNTFMANDPCERCGSTDLELHYLGYKPPEPWYVREARTRAFLGEAQRHR
jgi:hypothetical protein